MEKRYVYKRKEILNRTKNTPEEAKMKEKKQSVTWWARGWWRLRMQRGQQMRRM